ncbi:hypothetical protein D3C75_797620 [compost metagenome]
MPKLHCPRTCDELVVQSLISQPLIVPRRIAKIRIALRQESARHKGPERHRQNIDLVEGQPIFDHILIPVKNHLTIVNIKADHPAVGPAIVLLRQMKGSFVVRDGYERLDMMLFQFGKHTVIEPQAFLIRLRIVPVRKDSGPGDGHPVNLETHLGK